jgi:DNA repair photolyase
VGDFDTVRAKQNALAIIEQQLKSKRKTGVVGTGAMSDPYNTFETEHNLTRGALKLIDKYGFGIAISTKSNLIVRDIDVLKRIKTHSPVLCKITVTSCDDNLCKIIEPNVSLSSERFDAIKKLSKEGIYCGVLLMPVLPFITDAAENIISIVRLAKQSGANFIYPAFGMTLRENQREYYYNKLDEFFFGLKNRYIKQFGDSYSCGSPKAKELYMMFKKECDKLDVNYKMTDIIEGYKKGYQSQQMKLF